MFDIIGYWGVLTITLIFPILLGLWIFGGFTNSRVRELGGTNIEWIHKLDKQLNDSIMGILIVLGTIVSAILSFAWVIRSFTDAKPFTFIGWHSGFAEITSPVSGFVIAAVVALVVYDSGLRAYVRINKLVSKLEEKA